VEVDGSAIRGVKGCGWAESQFRWNAAVNLPSREPLHRVPSAPTSGDRGLGETPPAMPKSQKKYYAVKVGRGGPKIYDTWEEVRQQLSSSGSTGCSTTLYQCSKQVIAVLECMGNSWMVMPFGRSKGIPETDTRLFSA